MAGANKVDRMSLPSESVPMVGAEMTVQTSKTNSSESQINGSQTKEMQFLVDFAVTMVRLSLLICDDTFRSSSLTDKVKYVSNEIGKCFNVCLDPNSVYQATKNV